MNTRYPLYVQPNVDVLNEMTELVDAAHAYVSVHRGGTVHVNAAGETIEAIKANADAAEKVLTEAGYPVKRFSVSTMYLTLEAQATMRERIRPGTVVYDTAGDPECPEDTGTITSVQDGGYGVLWTGHYAPKFAASDEVAALSAASLVR